MKPEKQSCKAKKSDFTGHWRITKMSEWDADYCDMEIPAYINIEKNGTGEFQSGLMTGSLDGDFKKTSEGLLFDFTWDGSNECDEAYGDGWMKLKKEGVAEGEIRIHRGDSSSFWAKKKKTGGG